MLCLVAQYSQLPTTHLSQSATSLKLHISCFHSLFVRTKGWTYWPESALQLTAVSFPHGAGGQGLEERQAFKSLPAADQVHRIFLKILLLHMHWQNKKVFDHIKSPWTGCFIFMRRNWNTVFFISPWKTFKNHLKITSLTELFLQSVLSNVVVTFIFHTDWICYLVFFRSTLWRLFLGLIVEHRLPTNKTENSTPIKRISSYNQTMPYHPFLAFITLQTRDNIEFNTKV